MKVVALMTRTPSESETDASCEVVEVSMRMRFRMKAESVQPSWRKSRSYLPACGL